MNYLPVEAYMKNNHVIKDHSHIQNQHELGPFSQFAEKYQEQDISVIPIRANQKAPLLAGWQNYCGTLPTTEEIEAWKETYPNAGIGLALGEASNIVALDIDTDERDLLEIIESIIPQSPVRKRGKKGYTAFYRSNGQKSEKLALPDSNRPVVELLSTGNQAVLPPSIHPETSKSYEWLTPDTLLNLPASDLPELPTDIIGRLRTELFGLSSHSTVSDSSESGCGRNNTLKRIAIDLMKVNTPTDISIAHLLKEDQRLFPESPLFFDMTEGRRADPYTNAGDFYFSIMKSVNTKRLQEKLEPYTPNVEQVRNDHFSGPKEPATLEKAAFYGLAGEVVRTLLPHTESHPAALLSQLLGAFGNLVGPKPFYPVEADQHKGNLFVLTVGNTAKARKGTSLGRVMEIFESIDKDWEQTCNATGLSSGEGLIYHVRDRVIKVNDQGQEETIDPGITDKRLLVIETEFASALRVMGREGNTLSPVIRDAWDGNNLRTLTKNSPIKATQPYISIIGHITKQELSKLLKEVEIGNGFGNRFLFFYVTRSKELPFGGSLTEEEKEVLRSKLMSAVNFARTCEKTEFNEEAKALWKEVYSELSADKPGMLGKITARAEAQVVRLALLYALLDCSKEITVEHLRAALAVWEYSEASCRYIFNDTFDDPIANRIFSELKTSPNGLTRTEISNLFGRNLNKEKIEKSLNHLKQTNKVRVSYEDTNGRSIQRWFAL
jgi:hypothetical protein